MISQGQLTQRREQVQRTLEQAWPAEIEVLGLTTAPVACAGGTVSQTGSDLIPGGVLGDYTLVFRVRKTLLTGVPQANKSLKYLGKDWQIMRVIDSPHDVAYFIGADNIHK